MIVASDKHRIWCQGKCHVQYVLNKPTLFDKVFQWHFHGPANECRRENPADMAMDPHMNQAHAQKAKSKK
jgi:hypothetical protein